MTYLSISRFFNFFLCATCRVAFFSIHFFWRRATSCTFLNWIAKHSSMHTYNMSAEKLYDNNKLLNLILRNIFNVARKENNHRFDLILHLTIEYVNLHYDFLLQHFVLSFLSYLAIKHKRVHYTKNMRIDL